MYSEVLDKQDYNSIYAVEHVLENLHKDTVAELKKKYGDRYISETFDAIRESEIFVIRLKSTREPVGLYGLIEQENNSAGIFLLTCENLHKGNLITFLKEARKQVKQWSREYDLIMDYCDKQNKTIIKWLTLLGFKPAPYEDKDFQIYFKGDLSLYE